MRTVAIVLALAVSLVGVALFVRAVREHRRGDQTRPAGRRSSRSSGRAVEAPGGGDLGPYPDAAVEQDRDRALVRVRRLRCPVLHLDHRVRTAVRPAVRASGHRSLGGLRVGQRVDRLGRIDLDRVLDHRPGRQRRLGRQSRFFGSRTWQGVYVELTILGIVICVILIRAMEFHLLGAEQLAAGLPADLVRAALRHRRGRRPPAPSWSTAIKIIISMAWFVVIGLQHDHGRRLAPVHRLAEHLVQA